MALKQCSTEAQKSDLCDSKGTTPHHLGMNRFIWLCAWDELPLSFSTYRTSKPRKLKSKSSEGRGTATLR